MPAEAILVRGTCPHDCPDTCALLTTVKEGQAVQVQGNPQHAHTAGVLCTKVSRYTGENAPTTPTGFCSRSSAADLREVGSSSR